MRALAIILGGLVGMTLGYFAGVHVACDWLYPTSNLCGIYGVFYTGPAGLIVGAVAGWLMTPSTK